VALPQMAPHLLQRFKADYQNKKQALTRITTTIKTNLQEQVGDILESITRF
jgi:penicillin-binding protein 1C